jgi:hypothetical protein
VPRLGELLVAAGLIEHDKLEQGLRAQVVWGGRLGTNLIELGFIDLDELSRALGRQHGLPVALARHFEAADPELQARLSPELADRYSLVPLIGLADNKVALAGMDPLSAKAIVEVAAALKCKATDLVMSVAAEQRMRYQLERVYGIARGQRYLRSRGDSIPPFPHFGDFEAEVDSGVDVDIDAMHAGTGVDVDMSTEPDELDIPIEWDEQKDPPPATPRVNTDAMAALIEAAVSTSTPTPITSEASGRAKRVYVKTLADSDAAAPKLDADQKALGRIAIRKVAVGGTPPHGVVADKAGTLADAARAIRRSPHRDRVADLVVDALARFAPACEAALLLIIRGDIATGWRHFSRAGVTPPEVAVPLDAPGLVPTAARRAATVRASGKDLGAIDQRLLAALGLPNHELVVVPVAIAGQVMCVIAAATEPGAALPTVETIATSAGTAFARLMRDAGR